AMTKGGPRATSTVTPPRTAWATTPPTRADDNHTSSRRRGRLRIDPTSVAITTTLMRLVNSRFPHSTTAWYSHGPMIRPPSHAGHVGQPSPDPVTRTAAPASTIAMFNNSAVTARRPNARGETVTDEGRAPWVPDPGTPGGTHCRPTRTEAGACRAGR